MEENSELQKKMNRIKGQVLGIDKMISECRETTEIVTQISAVRAALSALAVEILKSESTSCFKQKTKQDKLEKFEELVTNFFKIT